MAAEGPPPLPAEGLELRRAHWIAATQMIVDATWSARSLQKAAARWATISLLLGLPASVVAALTAAGAGAAALLSKVPLLTAILALVAAVIAAAKAVLKPDETYQGYARKGASYLALRNDTRQFRSIRLRTPAIDAQELEKDLSALNQRLNSLGQQPPIRIPTWAYNEAKRSVAKGESEYAGDPFWEEPPF